MCASRFLGVAPWDLAEAPSYWLHVAESAQEAEAAAEREKGDKTATHPPAGRH